MKLLRFYLLYEWIPSVYEKDDKKREQNQPSYEHIGKGFINLKKHKEHSELVSRSRIYFVHWQYNAIAEYMVVMLLWREGYLNRNKLYPFHSWEWSKSNFPSSPTRNITSHSKENLAYYSLLRWKMTIITNSHLCIFSLKGWENGLFELRSERVMRTFSRWWKLICPRAIIIGVDWDGVGLRHHPTPHPLPTPKTATRVLFSTKTIYKPFVSKCSLLRRGVVRGAGAWERDLFCLPGPRTGQQTSLEESHRPNVCWKPWP